MHVNEYGSDDAPLLVLLAPMMVSGSGLYELLSPHFRGVYHIISPDQGGHGKAGDYISADEEYRELKTWLLERGYQKAALVYGASLGVAVAYRLFLDPAFEVAAAWFDGVALCENAAFAECFMKKLFRNRKKKLEKNHVEASSSLVKMYGYDFAQMMTKSFARITISDIDAICHACCHYSLRKLTEDEQSKLQSGLWREGLRPQIFQKGNTRLYAESGAEHPPGICPLRIYGGASKGVCRGNRTVYGGKTML